MTDLAPADWEIQEAPELTEEDKAIQADFAAKAAEAYREALTIRLADAKEETAKIEAELVKLDKKPGEVKVELEPANVEPEPAPVEEPKDEVEEKPKAATSKSKSKSKD